MMDFASKMRTVRGLLLPVVAVVAVLAGGADRAQAQFSVVINPEFGSTENTGATAKIDYSFTQSGDDVRMNWTVTNTTDGSAGLGATEASLIGIAFDLWPTATTDLTISYNDMGTNFDKFWSTGASLSPYGDFQYGISPDRPSFNGGNPTTGLHAGESMMVSFLLSSTSASALVATTVESAIKSAILDGTARIAGRFNSVNAGAGSDKVLGGIVPEPSTVILYALGLTGALGMGLARRRRNRLSA